MVVLVAHNELLHDAIETRGADGGIVRACPLYPGLACRDHLNAAVDIDNARSEDLVRVPFVELCPNTWLVLPNDEVVSVTEKDQFTPAAIQKQVRGIQKTLGTALPQAVFEKVGPLLEKAEKASDEEDWRAVLTTLAGLEKVVPTPHASFDRLLAAPLETVEEMVRFDAEDLLASDAPTAEEKAAAVALLEQVDVAVYGTYLPIRDALRGWVEEQATK